MLAAPQSEIGPRGRSCTRTGDALDVVSLLLDYARLENWILQPVLPRQEFFTKEIRSLLRGGKMVAVPGAAPGAAGL